jgi:hypothetical protein
MSAIGGTAVNRSLHFVFALGVLGTLGVRPLTAADRPNVVIILADDKD